MDLETIEVDNQVPVEPADTSAAVGLMEQHIVISQAQSDPTGSHPADTPQTSEIQVEPEVHIQLQPEFQTEVQVLNLPQHSASLAALQQTLGQKRPNTSDDEGMMDNSPVPRKKTRTYLDSHKVIEKKRRDRINQCLNIIKSLVPDCRQYGNKKLDKAEILEMNIEYLQRLQQQGVRSTGVADIMQAQREMANDIMTWIVQNKLLYSGPNALDQFCNNLLLHLQSYGGQSTANSLQGIASLLLNQASDDNDTNQQLYRQLIAHHLQQQQDQDESTGGGAAADEQEPISRTVTSKQEPDEDAQQKEQKEQMQQIQNILLQQIIQQQLQQQNTTSGAGGGIEPSSTTTSSSTNSGGSSGLTIQQLQMLIGQQLSAQDSAGKQSSVQQLLTTLQQLQQLSQKHGLQLLQTAGEDDEDATGQAASQGIAAINNVFADPSMNSSHAADSETELSLTTDQGQDGVTSATEESVYTSTIEGLPENLLNTSSANVQGVQMWSGETTTADDSTEPTTSSSLLILQDTDKS